MIKVENIEVWGFEHAIRGMRNPLNSWDRSDSYHAVDCGKCGRIEREGICYPKEHDCTPYYCYEIGENDLTLMRKLFAADDSASPVQLQSAAHGYYDLRECDEYARLPRGS